MSAQQPQQQAPKTTKELLQTQQENDDEFEEFPVEDWDASQTFSATLANNQGQKKAGENGLESLWDDTWDDDDVSDDFSVQLKQQLEKEGQMAKST